MNEMSALKEYAFLVTSRFESRGYDSIQTKDKGIVSYGLHQATLASGSLEKIIKRYLMTSKTQTAIELEKYLPQIDRARYCVKIRTLKRCCRTQLKNPL